MTWPGGGGPRNIGGRQGANRAMAERAATARQGFDNARAYLDLIAAAEGVLEFLEPRHLDFHLEHRTAQLRAAVDRLKGPEC